MDNRFCVRTFSDFVKGHKLKLDKEPSVGAILDAATDLSRYKEVVFCGYGEPTTRLDVLKEVATALKKENKKIRVVTNGHGNLINKRPIAKELAGLVDAVSVSLNAETESKYNAICKPEFGAKTYNAILDFIKACVKNSIETEVTCVEVEGIDVKKCEGIAKSLGASFRLRSFGAVG